MAWGRDCSQAAIINKRKFCMWRVNANRQAHTHRKKGSRGRREGKRGDRAVENVKLMHKVYSNKINNSNSSSNKNDNDNMQIKSQNASREREKERAREREKCE